MDELAGAISDDQEGSRPDPGNVLCLCVLIRHSHERGKTKDNQSQLAASTHLCCERNLCRSEPSFDFTQNLHLWSRWNRFCNVLRA
jgi:hypothetical protein